MPSERTIRSLSALLALIGVGVATYIAISDSGGGAPACLAGGGGCETVAKSAYSHLAGVNVAVIGIAGYLALLGAALASGDAARFGGLIIAVVGFGFSLYLTYLELFVISAICQWCVASAVLMTMLLALSAIRAARFAGDELRREDAGMEPPLGRAA